MQKNLSWFQIVKKAATDYLGDNAFEQGAALAYYTIFSAAPLLIIAVAITGFVFGNSAAKEDIIAKIESFAGPKPTEMIQTMLANASRPEAGKMAAVVGMITLGVGALGVFSQLKATMNTVWKVEPKPSPGIWYYMLTYFFLFGFVVVIGLLFLALLMASAALSFLNSYFPFLFPDELSLMYWGNVAASFAVITFLFAIIFKVLPDATVRWRDIWPGAIITSLLFAVGKVGLGWYLTYGATASTFGAAGSLVVLLLWIYWSAQIFLFGAEITQVYAQSRGEGVHPKPYARRVLRP